VHPGNRGRVFDHGSAQNGARHERIMARESVRRAPPRPGLPRVRRASSRHEPGSAPVKGGLHLDTNPRLPREGRASSRYEPGSRSRRAAFVST
jgi:hypothetical protein